ncbi:hypothetical protein GGI03_000773 [Coemansia sp. RSA 2337]|nr:hypothetical protein H4S04_007432 [Coemansia sp. S16]KAJ2340005.1 hypothetical protein GGH92_006462 [Coemansia sp. RSA 2673]KAJ2468778.1 hypothetical protein GGI03_000773 [Coemansia sp. RSA 2337]
MLLQANFGSLRGRAFMLMCALAILSTIGILGIISYDHRYFTLTNYGLSKNTKTQKVRTEFQEYLQQVHREIHSEDVRAFCSQDSFDKEFRASVEQRYKNITTHGMEPIFIAANLHNSQNILPNMALQLLALVDTLGHGRVFISIYENGSEDRTKEILHRFDSTLESLGIAHQILTDDSPKPMHIHRIEYLAKVRNLALEPLYSSSAKYGRVLFLNDIFFCMTDLLELLFQARAHSAHLTCGEDFDMFNGGPGFYDIWITRDMHGEMPKKEMHRISNDDISMVAQMRDRPFQVQCCWNGAALIDAQVFRGDNGLRFRRSAEGECSASECSLFCNDMWAKGFRRTVMVPRVKVSYDINTRNLLRTPTFFPADIPFNNPEVEKISFRSGPDDVICFPLNGIDSRNPDGPAVYVKI